MAEYLQAALTQTPHTLPCSSMKEMVFTPSCGPSQHAAGC
ncbi:hypothetical protein HMPREF0742_00698 [Rothia aeria F0184]|uniref:Uncharacterized protein n=1 Tax=Rothia aeria F0184 TaxID=888019 RepID=U7V608_9MICC|nr:hypothetical protein HMPREF0742_00698 [Rothia aeria F0184]